MLLVSFYQPLYFSCSFLDNLSSFLDPFYKFLQEIELSRIRNARDKFLPELTQLSITLHMWSLGPID